MVLPETKKVLLISSHVSSRAACHAWHNQLSPFVNSITRLSHVLSFYNPHTKSYVLTCSAMFLNCDDSTWFTYSRLHGLFACFCHLWPETLYSRRLLTSDVSDDGDKQQHWHQRWRNKCFEQRQNFCGWQQERSCSTTRNVSNCASHCCWFCSKLDFKKAESGAGERRILSWILSTVLGIMVPLQPTS